MGKRKVKKDQLYDKSQQLHNGWLSGKTWHTLGDPAEQHGQAAKINGPVQSYVPLETHLWLQNDLPVLLLQAHKEICL